MWEYGNVSFWHIAAIFERIVHSRQLSCPPAITRVKRPFFARHQLPEKRRAATMKALHFCARTATELHDGSDEGRADGQRVERTYRS
jgi:hypothetical protein